MKIRLMLLCALAMVVGGCKKTPSAAPSMPAEQKENVVPTVCLYTMGDVDSKLRRAMMDSLQAHYTRVRDK